MSRVANAPIEVPDGVNVTLDGQHLAVKGSKGDLDWRIHDAVEVTLDGGVLKVAARDESKSARSLAGTTRALVNNMVVGVSAGFQRKLEIVGVGYRAQASGQTLNLTLGYSHPIEYQVPVGVTVETPSQTEIVVSGIDKQAVGQVAANIRAYRKPEPYKGKGVRYSGEQILRKEAKKS